MAEGLTDWYVQLLLTAMLLFSYQHLVGNNVDAAYVW